MIYTLVWAPAFIDALKNLPTDDATLVANNVMALARDPRPLSRTVVELDDDLYVLQVGACDVLYAVSGLTVRVLLVARRAR